MEIDLSVVLLAHFRESCELKKLALIFLVFFQGSSDLLMFKSPLSLSPGCKVTYKTSDRDVWENLAFNVSKLMKMLCVEYIKNAQHLARNTVRRIWIVFVKGGFQQAHVTSHVLFEQQIESVKATAKNSKVHGKFVKQKRNSRVCVKECFI